VRCDLGSALEQATQTKAFALLFGLLLLGGGGRLLAEELLRQCGIVGLAIGGTLFLRCALVALAVTAITGLGGPVVALRLLLWTVATRGGGTVLARLLRTITAGLLRALFPWLAIAVAITATAFARCTGGAVPLTIPTLARCGALSLRALLASTAGAAGLAGFAYFGLGLLGATGHHEGMIFHLRDIALDEAGDVAQEGLLLVIAEAQRPA
jgi:hypothetical protein